MKVGGGDTCTIFPASAVAVWLITLTFTSGMTGMNGAVVVGVLFVTWAGCVPSGVADTAAKGGVGVIVPPPIIAVGNGVPNASKV